MVLTKEVIVRVTKPAPERRQEIIDTAREMFLENGFDKTQMADISKRLNIASGLVYHYFNSKNEVFYAVIDEMADEQLRMVEKLISATRGNAKTKLKKLMSFMDKSDKSKALGESIASDKAILEYCHNKLSDSIIPLLVALIEEGNKDGSWKCRYPREITMFIMHGLVGVAEYCNKKGDLTGKANTMRNVVFRVLGVG
jgi:AcrR family transcriptional regulator